MDEDIMNVKHTRKGRIIIRDILKKPSIRGKIMSFLFIAIGISILFINQDPVFQKIGFGIIFVGIFAFFIITEKTVPKIINDAQMISNMDLIYSLTRNLNLKGNGIYIPAKNKLSKERVFIPMQEKEDHDIPELDDNMIFVTGKQNENSSSEEKKIVEIYAVLVPPGLELLETYERELGIKVSDLDINELEQYLQIMIYGYDLIKDLTIDIIDDNTILLKIRHSAYKEICEKVEKNMDDLYKQTGCPICSSILCAITRTLGKNIKIEEVNVKDSEIIYNLKIGV